MPNDKTTQRALAADPAFRNRLKASMLRMAAAKGKGLTGPIDRTLVALAGVLVFHPHLLEADGPPSDAVLDRTLSEAWEFLSAVPDWDAVRPTGD